MNGKRKPTQGDQANPGRELGGDLIGTKLFPPGAMFGLVERRRINSLMDPAKDLPRLATVTAPAGYGKSTVMCQWWEGLGAAGVPCAWVSLDADDNDPVRLLSYLAGALAPLFPDTDLARSIDTGLIRSVKTILRSLVRLLETIPGRFAIFLDDYHVIAAPDVDEVIDWLLVNAPAGMMLAVASRTQPGFSSRNLKLRNQLLELEAGDLSFRLDEADAFVNRFQDLDLGPDAVKALRDRTEGWIAGLQLASLALSDQIDRAEFVSNFSGDDRDITDYLGEVVLAQLPIELRRFLLTCSVLDRMCPELCAELTGLEPAAAMLDTIERRGLFLFPLDRDRTWYRFHHLFGDFLRKHAFAEAPEAARDACLTASRWFEANGSPNEAIRCAFRGGDLARAADLVAENALPIVQNRGEHATLINWMAGLPAEVIDARPRIRLGNAWASIFTRRYTEAEREFETLLAYCDDRLQTDLDPTDTPLDEIRCSVEMMKCVLFAMIDDSDRCRRNSADWLVKWPDAIQFNKGTVGNALGYACLGTFEFDLGRKALEEARLNFERCGGHYGVAWADAILGMICMRQGCLEEAVAVYERGADYTVQALGSLSYAGTMLSLLYAETLYERNRLGEAEKRLEDAFTLIHEHGSLDMALIGYGTMAKLRLTQERRDEAFDVLADGERLGRFYEQPRLWLSLTGLRAMLLLQSGARDDARRVIETAGFFDGNKLMGEDHRDVTREVPKLVMIRWWLADGEPGRALSLIRGLLARARKTGRRRKVVELLNLQALAHCQLGREGEALRSLDEALRLAEVQGYRRIFMDEGPELGRLLAIFAEHRAGSIEPTDDSITYLNDLITGCGGNPADAVGNETEDGFEPEPLTKRERQLLTMIDSGLSNAQLAESLFISEQTVKWHLHNVYGKLGVRNRTGALARAGRLDLI